MSNGKFETINKAFNSYCDAAKELRKACIEYLSSVLSENNGNIVINEDDMPCICYDGGNHVEYASTMSSACYGAFTQNNTIYLNIEDCDEYEIDRVPTDDLYSVCEAIETTLKYNK